jgi:hypothetical protein
MHIGEANQEAAFGTNKNGYDVFKLERYLPVEIANEEHRQNLLTDAQWQKVIDAVDEVIKKLEI